MARKKANKRADPSPPKAARGGRAPRGTKARARPKPQGDREAVQIQSLPSFPVIGIGASAGGLEACTQILETLPADLRAAVILVQHLDPKHESALPELLRVKCRLPVLQVKDRMKIEPGHVYVIPPGTRMGIVEGRLRLTARPLDGTRHKPVDFFLHSLAAYAQTQAIAIIVSGTDADGSIGIREIKAAGGITIAQDPRTAKYDGMPRSALATGMVDLILSPADIANELVRIALHPFVAARRAEDAEPDTAGDRMARIFTLLRNASGVDFTHYKQPTIKRRLQRRMVLHKITSVDQYLRFLQQNPAEVHSLYQDLLIHVTRFFRDPETFETLAKRVFPRMTSAHGQDASVRVWVPGCSTGEEAYSVAIAILEFLGERTNVPVQIFATDVSETAIDHARAGLYPQSIDADVSPERLRRFFIRADGNYRVNKRVRDLCVFARQDLTRDSPFSRIDLIVCRNVLIYLGPVLQRKLMNVFHYALKPEGFLLLGGAESIGVHADMFEAFDKKHRIHTRRAGHPQDIRFPPVDYTTNRVAPVRPAAEMLRPNTVLAEANRVLLSRYSPPGVIVDEGLKIVQFRGQTGAYLEPAPGAASLDLLKMVREGLLHGLRQALNEARNSRSPVRREGLRVKHNGHTREVNVEVIPLNGAPEGRHFLIMFEDAVAPAAPPAPQPAVPRRRAGAREDRRISHLEEELAANREFLQSTIQNLEASNEELQSANEEILSANEELQSTNEELDTAKEELQSTNEELNTVNEELQARNEELSRINSDLVNLLGSVQIAIVMVSGDLRIRRFTPMAEKVLNVIPTDVGRPIGDIKPNIEAVDLEALITETIESVTTHEQEVRDRRGNWYSLRIRPYKNIENRIDGAVVALFDIDAARRQEIEAREARQYADAIIETVREPLLVLDSDLRVRRANAAFWQAFHTTPADTQGRAIYELGQGQWDIPELRRRLQQVAVRPGQLENFRVEHEFPGLGRRVMLLTARALHFPDSRSGLVLLAIEDITGRDISA